MSSTTSSQIPNAFIIIRALSFFSFFPFIPLLALIDSIVIISCRNRCQNGKNVVQAKRSLHASAPESGRPTDRRRHTTLRIYSELLEKNEFLSRFFVAFDFIVLWKDSRAPTLSPRWILTFMRRKSVVFSISSAFKWRPPSTLFLFWKCDNVISD